MFIISIKTDIEMMKNEKKFQEKTSIHALKQIKSSFDKHGVKCWLNIGILLGTVRNEKILNMRLKRLEMM